MNIKSHDPQLDAALTNVQKKFRERIINSYLDLKRNCIETRHEAAGISAGKFCETVLRHIQNMVFGTFTPFNRKIGNLADDCRKLIMASSGNATESERVILPRALVFLYTMRNKRGIGHTTGDVDANAIDIALMARSADWILCELIRIYHGMSLEEAQDLLDNIAVRQLPIIWEVAGKKRVLKAGLPAKDQVLLLLYSAKDTAILVEDLFNWIEYSRMDHFKASVLKHLHKSRMIEYDKDTETVFLSPKGAERVEKHLL
jgi:hypothetical protein